MTSGGFRLLGGFHTLRASENNVMQKLEIHEQYVVCADNPPVDVAVSCDSRGAK